MKGWLRACRWEFGRQVKGMQVVVWKVCRREFGGGLGVVVRVEGRLSMRDFGMCVKAR